MALLPLCAGTTGGVGDSNGGEAADWGDSNGWSGAVGRLASLGLVVGSGGGCAGNGASLVAPVEGDATAAAGGAEALSIKAPAAENEGPGARPCMCTAASAIGPGTQMPSAYLPSRPPKPASIAQS